MKQENPEKSIAYTKAFNPHVVARQPTHEKVVKWFNKSSSNLMGWFGLFGLVFLFLPICIKPWRLIVEQVPVLSQICVFLTSQQGGNFFIYYFAPFAITCKLSSYKLYPKVDEVFLTNKLPPYEIYPHTKKEEIGFWLGALLQTIGMVFFMYFPFGMIAFFFKV